MRLTCRRNYAWLLRERPAVAARIGAVCDIGAFLYQQWFGRPMPMSLSIASWTGLLDTARCAWHDDYARLLVGERLRSKLPPLADYNAVAVGLADDYGARWPQLRDLPFFPALGDGAVANIGSGAVDEAHVALTIGTTSALRVIKRSARVPAGLWRYLVTSDLPLIGGATSEGGNIYQWAAAALRLDSEAEAALSRREPDAHGLTVLPLLAGERAPGWRAGAVGTIHGLRLHSSGLDILQAQLEAVALRLSLIFDALDAGAAVVMAGGGALGASPAWARMIADACDSPIQLLSEPEVTARGVALLLRHSLDGVALDADAPEIAAVIEPEAWRVCKMRAARARQMELYRRLYD